MVKRHKKPKLSKPRAQAIFHCPKNNKLAYETEEEARKDAKRMRKKYGPKLAQYLCQYCGKWHNGHNRPPAFRKIDPPIAKP